MYVQIVATINLNQPKAIPTTQPGRWRELNEGSLPDLNRSEWWQHNSHEAALVFILQGFVFIIYTKYMHAGIEHMVRGEKESKVKYGTLSRIGIPPAWLDDKVNLYALMKCVAIQLLLVT